MNHEVHVKQVPPQRVATRRFHTKLSELGHDMESTVSGIAGAVEPVGAARGAPFAVYHNEPFTPDDIDVEMGLPLAREANLRGTVDAKASELPGGPVAYTIHVGDYQSIGAAYEALYGWLEKHGYRAKGPPREIYLVGPSEGVVPSEYRTEIDVPVA